MNTVLIVEDEKMIRQGIRAIVQRSGVPIQNIMECNNGQLALEILENQPVDVMFTDIRMPKMDGIELVEAMQKLEHKPLTVVISGYDDFSYAVQMMRLGVREYILKPIEREQVTAILKKFDEELAKADQSAQQAMEIGCQQLKYLILNDNITRKEIQTVAQQFEKQLLNQEYMVCCCGQSTEQTEKGGNYLFLGEIEESDVYIVGRTNKESLLQNELRDAYIGISGVHCGVSDLRAAYREAKSARIEAFLRVRHEVQYSAGLQDAASNHTAWNEAAQEERGRPVEERIRQIAQMIGTDRISGALKMTEQFFSEVKWGRHSAETFEKSINLLLDEILQIYRNALTENEVELARFRNLYQFAQIEELMEELTGWMIGFHERIDTEFDDYRNKSRMEQAVAFIQENYATDLNMAVVSNHVSMNYSLFSYAFKQYTGKNFVNYLKEIRVNEAKRLLAETDMRVIEISQQVGYENEKHFMKIFKSVSGVSPTEYRKNMQLGT